jgi:hypothetical protein
MKVTYVYVKRNYRHRPFQIDPFFAGLFHGTARVRFPDASGLQVGTMKIRARNTHEVPPIFLPQFGTNLVLSGVARKRLEGISGILFRPVEIEKYYHYAWSPGPASYFECQKRFKSFEEKEGFAERGEGAKPAAPIKGNFEELCSYGSSFLARNYQDVKQLVVDAEKADTFEDQELFLNGEIVEQFPVLRIVDPLLRVDVFNALRVYMNEDFFEFRELDFDV